MEKWVAGSLTATSLVTSLGDVDEVFSFWELASRIPKLKWTLSCEGLSVFVALVQREEFHAVFWIQESWSDGTFTRCDEARCL